MCVDVRHFESDLAVLAKGSIASSIFGKGKYKRTSSLARRINRQVCKLWERKVEECPFYEDCFWERLRRTLSVYLISGLHVVFLWLDVQWVF